MVSTFRRLHQLILKALENNEIDYLNEINFAEDYFYIN